MSHGQNEAVDKGVIQGYMGALSAGRQALFDKFWR